MPGFLNYYNDMFCDSITFKNRLKVEVTVEKMHGKVTSEWLAAA